jgi:beta-glucosidase
MKSKLNIASVLTTLLSSAIFSACTSSPQITSKMTPGQNSLSAANRKIAQVSGDGTPEERAKQLVSQMTLDEKLSQMNDLAPAIPRLGIPVYNWHTEGAHGAWAWSGRPATVYPQVIGLGATWDKELVHEVANFTSDELRAVWAEDYKNTPEKTFNNGLSIYAPNINIFRDPRWGRGQETYGEDPYLTSQMSVEFIKGLQGNDPKYLKVAATAKHFFAYSGPEANLFEDDLKISEKDLRETYMPAFQAAVEKGHTSSVMCAYGSVNGFPSCANPLMLSTVLRHDWGFQGPVQSDCGAIHYIWEKHKFTTDGVQGVTKALQAGADLACGTTGNRDFDENIKIAVKTGVLSESNVDLAVTRLFTQRFRLGEFADPADVSYSKLSVADIDSPAHRALALKAAQESMVLLKNAKHFLPLPKNLKQVSIIGPNASDTLTDDHHTPMNILFGTYHGTNPKYTTALAGITEKLKQTKIVYNDGTGDIANAVKGSDVAILVMGLYPVDDDKHGEFVNGEGEGNDREGLDYPPEQLTLMQKVQATGVPFVVVQMSGSALYSDFAEHNAKSILQAWYPGEEGGKAIADVLFGDYNPSGKLPVTFYHSEKDIPDFEDYKMEGRTYRYFRGKPAYPFGYGLSYSRFQYSNLKLSTAKVRVGKGLKVKASVQNLGFSDQPKRDGDEIVQVYVSGPVGLKNQPIRSLKAFSRIHLNQGEARSVGFTIDHDLLSIVSEDGTRSMVPGTYTVSLGGQQPDGNAEKREVRNVLLGTFEITR